MEYFSFSNVFYALGGVSIIGIIITRLLPDEKVIALANSYILSVLVFCNKIIFPTFENAGKFLTGFGNKKLGAVWKTLEDILIHSVDLVYFTCQKKWNERFGDTSFIGECYKSFKKGLRYDNNVST